MFNLAKKEYTRQIKNGRLPDYFFCNLSCAMSWRNIHDKSLRAKQMANLGARSRGNTYAKKGDFTYILNRVKQRCDIQKMDFDLDEAYLHQIWTDQQFRCAITKITLSQKSGRNKPDTISLDRKDSNKDYVKGNVQFVAYSVNLAKNSFSDEEILHFFEMVKAPESPPEP